VTDEARTARTAGSSPTSSHRQRRYDNSTKNALNPDPTKAVRFGEQTWDEMMNGFFDFTVDSQKQAVPSSSRER